jgi:hypothetical protein
MKPRGHNIVELPKPWSAQEKASAKRFCMALWRLLRTDNAIEAEKQADELIAAMEEWEQ